MNKQIKIQFMIMLFYLIMVAGCGKSVEQQIIEQLELGQKYLTEQNYEEAVVAFNKVIELEPKNREAYIERGDTYYFWAVETQNKEVMEKYQKAIADYETALMIKSDVQLQEKVCTLYDIMADWYEKEGNVEKAIEFLSKSYELVKNEEVYEKIQELESGIKQWSAALTESEEAIFEKALAAIDGGSNEVITETLARSDLLELVENYGIATSFGDHIWMDYGNTINGKGASFCMLKTQEGKQWLYVYYGMWKNGLADGDGTLISLYIDHMDEAYQEQIEKAVGIWSEGVAEGEFVYEQTFYGGTQAGYLTTITGTLKKGLWEGKVKETSTESGRVLMNIYSTFVNGMAMKTGEKESTYGISKYYGIDDEGNLTSGVFMYSENDASNMRKCGVLWSHTDYIGVYETGSLSYYLSKDNKVYGDLLYGSRR